MEIANQMMPIILYSLLCILIVVAIVFLYKLTKTIDKANIVLDDAYGKVKKLDNLFEIVDKSADVINIVTDKFVNFFTSSILKIFKKKGKVDDIDE